MMSPFHTVPALGEQEHEMNAKSSFEQWTGKRHQKRIPRNLLELKVKKSCDKL